MSEDLVPDAELLTIGEGECASTGSDGVASIRPQREERHFRLVQLGTVRIHGEDEGATIGGEHRPLVRALAACGIEGGDRDRR